MVTTSPKDARIRAGLTLVQVSALTRKSLGTLLLFEADPSRVRASSREILAPFYRRLSSGGSAA
jgi:hypothetical protein